MRPSTIDWQPTSAAHEAGLSKTPALPAVAFDVWNQLWVVRDTRRKSPGRFHHASALRHWVSHAESVHDGLAAGISEQRAAVPEAAIPPTQNASFAASLCGSNEGDDQGFSNFRREVPVSH